MTQHLCEVKKKYSLPRKVFVPEPKVCTECFVTCDEQTTADLSFLVTVTLTPF